MTALPIDILVRASALLAAAALADVALGRRGSAATRHLVWALAVAALLALPIASYALPQWQVRIPVERTAPAVVREPAATAPVSGDPVAMTPASIQTADPVAAPAARTDTFTPISFAAAVTAGIVLYAAGVLFLLARLLVEPLALRRLTRRSHDVVDPAWLALLGACARQLHVNRAVRLVQSERDVMPLTFGTTTPTIVLPAAADDWHEDRRRAVLLHEMAHVARRDCFVQRLSALVCAFYWPHPGVWWAAHRLRVERELACDDRVLAAGAPARDYAGHLLELAHSLGRAPAPATALGMARARHLENRLLAILDAARNRASLHRRGFIVSVAISLALFVPMAALRAAVVFVEPGRAESPAVAALTALVGQDFTGTWDVRPAQDPTMVHVSVRTATGSHGRTMTMAQLEAMMSTVRVSSPNAPVKLPANATLNFPIRREAGTFTIDGVCRNGACAGTFSFAPDPAYADMLAKRGIGRPTPAQQFALAIADVGAAYLDALAAAGYARPDVETLARAAEHGVDIGYLRDMAALGYRLGTLDPLIRLRDHGVDPSFVRGMDAAGYAHLSVENLLLARDHGADDAYARAMAGLGFRGLPLPALINARDHGVDQDYVRDMQALGHRLTLDDYIRTRDHGVDPGFIRGLAAQGYTGLSVDALVGARDHGVDPEYVRGMAAAGYKGVPMEDLIRMRDHGVDPEYVRRVQQRGSGHLSVDEIIHRRDRGDSDPHDAAMGMAMIGAARLRTLWRSFAAWLHA